MDKSQNGEVLHLWGIGRIKTSFSSLQKGIVQQNNGHLVWLGFKTS